MIKPVFVLLSGLPGSGKSTFRARPVFNDYVHLSSDDIVEAYARQVDKTYDEVWSTAAPTAMAAINNAFEAAIRARKSIIWDQTNLAAKKRKALLARLPKGYFSVAVCFQIDEGLRQQRIQNRPGKTIPASVDRQMQAVFVPPDTSEGFNLVTVPQELVLLGASRSMTTIAFKDGTLAADTMLTRGNERSFGAVKAYRTQRFLIGLTGLTAVVAPFIDFVKRHELEIGDDAANLHQFWEDEAPNYGEYSALMVNRHGTIWHAVGAPPARIGSVMDAIGTGGGYALGAMAFGATAAEAVRVARRFDVNTGGPVQTIRFDD